MLRSDNAGWRARIGVITPHFDPVPESECWALAPTGVSVHSVRAPLGLVDQNGNTSQRGFPDAARAFAEGPHLEAAAALLAALVPRVVIYCYTSSSYVSGSAGELVLRERLERRTQCRSIVIAAEATRLALTKVGARRITLVHPPWFNADADRAGAEYYRAAGFEVVFHASTPLRADFGEVHPGELYEWVRVNTPDTAEAVLIAGNGLRAVGIIATLEEDIGRPVITANQAAFWHALRLARVNARVDGYGRLFDADKSGEGITELGSVAKFSG